MSLTNRAAIASTQLALARAVAGWLAHAESSGYENRYAAMFDTGRDERALVCAAADSAVQALAGPAPQREAVARQLLADVARALGRLAAIDEVGVDMFAAAIAAVEEQVQVQAAQDDGHAAAALAQVALYLLGEEALSDILELQASAMLDLRAAAFRRVAEAWGRVAP